MSGGEAVLAFPRGVCDPLCVQGHVIETTTDHRLLWHLESLLSVSSTNGYQREAARNLRRYLNETCQHHWHERTGDDDIAAYRICLWCNDVILSAADA